MPPCQSRYLMRIILTYLSFWRILENVSKLLKTILADNNPNWVNTPKIKQLLPSSITTLFSHSINLLAEALRKLATNLIPVINSTSLVIRSWILETFDGTNLDKLNNFLF